MSERQIPYKDTLIRVGLTAMLTLTGGVTSPSRTYAEDSPISKYAYQCFTSQELYPVPVSPQEQAQALTIAQEIIGLGTEMSEEKNEFYRKNPDGKVVVVSIKPAEFEGADLLIKVMSDWYLYRQYIQKEDLITIYPDRVENVVRCYTDTYRGGTIIPLDKSEVRRAATLAKVSMTLANLQQSTPS